MKNNGVNFKPNKRSGFTMAEMLTTVAVLAIVAVIAIPSSQPTAEARATAAANEVANAFRFAREEAMRTSAYRMVACDTVKNTLSVYVPDPNGGVAALVQDPLTKMSYSIVLSQLPTGSGTALTSCNFVFGKNRRSTIAFDPLGDPMQGPNTGNGNPNSPTVPLSIASTVQVVADNVTRSIVVDVTGRVTTTQ